MAILVTVFTNIVVGTDGSTHAERALRAAAAVAERETGAVLHVVSAYHPMAERDLQQLKAQLPEEFHGQLTGNFMAENDLDSARSILVQQPVETHYHAVSGDPTDAILDVAERFGADLIVVGSRGEGPVKRAIHGSVSTKVVHHAPCSIMVVRDDEG